MHISERFTVPYVFQPTIYKDAIPAPSPRLYPGMLVVSLPHEYDNIKSNADTSANIDHHTLFHINTMNSCKDMLVSQTYVYSPLDILCLLTV